MGGWSWLQGRGTCGTVSEQLLLSEIPSRSALQVTGAWLGGRTLSLKLRMTQRITLHGKAEINSQEKNKINLATQ